MVQLYSDRRLSWLSSIDLNLRSRSKSKSMGMIILASIWYIDWSICWAQNAWAWTCGPPTDFKKTHGDEKIYLIEVTFVIPNAAHVYSDSQIAFTGSWSCACIISRLSIKLHFIFSCTDKKQRSHAERGRMDPADEIMEGQATDRSLEVQHWIRWRVWHYLRQAVIKRERERGRRKQNYVCHILSV